MSVDTPDRKVFKSTSRRRTWLVLILVAVFGALVLVTNTVWVDSKTRAAAPRDGGSIIETGIEPTNVKVEGRGSPMTDPAETFPGAVPAVIVAPWVWPEMRFSAPGVEGPNCVLNELSLIAKFCA